MVISFCRPQSCSINNPHLRLFEIVVFATFFVWDFHEEEFDSAPDSQSKWANSWLCFAVLLPLAGFGLVGDSNRVPKSRLSWPHQRHFIRWWALHQSAGCCCPAETHTSCLDKNWEKRKEHALMIRACVHASWWLSDPHVLIRIF